MEGYRNCKKRNKAVGFVMAVVLIFTCMPILLRQADVQAYEEMNGTVMGTSVRVRQGAGTDTAEITQLTGGHEVHISGEAEDSSGMVWYQISFTKDGNAMQGYMRSDYVLAALDKDGYVTGDGVNVRSGAGTANDKITQLNTGHEVHIKGQLAASNGVMWYQITFTKDGQAYEGYMSSAYVRASDPVVPDDPQPEEPSGPVDDPEYEKYLEQQGFPESYRTYLRALHKQNPLWIFVAKPTDIQWENAVAAESKLRVNLVPSSSITSYKSLKSGAIDWSTGKWVGFDTDRWVAASESVVRHYLDPRSFLKDENTILQFESLSYEESQTKEGVENIIKGTYMEYGNTVIDGVTIDFADIFMKAGRESGVSPYHLATRARQETGVNGSNSSKQFKDEEYAQFNGYYNFFNIGAAPDKDGNNAMFNGLSRAAAEGWDSPEKSIVGGAKIVAQNYISKEQNTLYFQKFDVVDGGNGYYSHQYMTNLLAAESEARTMEKTYTDFRGSAITFIVPVYQNVPNEPEARPIYDGSAYSILDSLEVSGLSLDKWFDGYKFQYSVPYVVDADTVQINASTNAPGAVVTGTGTAKLQAGENDIAVTCTGTDGTANTYHITITRTGTVRGMGDVNGDGLVNSSDALWILRASAQLDDLLEGDFKYADVNGNGMADAEDALFILQYITGFKEEL